MAFLFFFHLAAKFQHAHAADERHDERTGDGGQQESHTGRESKAPGEEVKFGRLLVLEDEHQKQDEKQASQDQGNPGPAC